MAGLLPSDPNALNNGSGSGSGSGSTSGSGSGSQSRPASAHSTSSHRSGASGSGSGGGGKQGGIVGGLDMNDVRAFHCFFSAIVCISVG
jgi:hypothetical protein